jgi:hypothetical protein
VLSFSRDEDKHKTVNKGCAAMRRGKSMGKTLGIALVPVPGGANFDDGGLTARR